MNLVLNRWTISGKVFRVNRLIGDVQADWWSEQFFSRFHQVAFGQERWMRENS